MATRSTIAVQHANGTVSQIYAHWDGYLEGNGLLLANYYNSLELAEQLVALGDISSLGERINPHGDTHTFDTPEDDVTVYYGRDRGEHGIEPNTYANFSEYKNHSQSEDYDYVFLNGEWFVRYDSSDFVSLGAAFAQQGVDSGAE